MHIVSGQVVLDEIEQCAVDQASDELDRIEDIKEDVVLAIDAGRRMMEPDVFREYAASMEEHFDDAFHAAWQENFAICRTMGRESIPSCAQLRLRRKIDGEHRLRELNMATAQEAGMLNEAR